MVTELSTGDRHHTALPFGDSSEGSLQTELSTGDRHRTAGGDRFRTRELESRDFAFGARGNELYFP